MNITELPLCITSTILSFLPLKDFCRSSEVCHTFLEARDDFLRQLKEFPEWIPLRVRHLLLPKCPNLRVFRGLGKIPLHLMSTCPRLELVYTNDISSVFISSVLMSLIFQRESALTSLRWDIRDWENLPYDELWLLGSLFNRSPLLTSLAISCDSLVALPSHQIFKRLGKELTRLELHCWVSSIKAFKVGMNLRELVSPLNQQDFNYVCKNCPDLLTLEETTYEGIPLDEYEYVVLAESDELVFNDILLDIQPLFQLKKLRNLKLTSLLHPQSRSIICEFIKRYGRQLKSLSLNLTNGIYSPVGKIIKYCRKSTEVKLWVDPFAKEIVWIALQSQSFRKVEVLHTFCHNYKLPTLSDYIL